MVIVNHGQTTEGMIEQESASVIRRGVLIDSPDISGAITFLTGLLGAW